MAEVKVLIEGYTSVEKQGKTASTISLVRDKEIVMVVDPGVTKAQDILDALKKEGLAKEDVNFVFITHSHIDHYKNMGIFPRAKILEYFGIWEEDKEEIQWKEDFTPNIKILKTPGHDYSSLTLLVKSKEGIIAICGDVFWKENFPEKDQYASDEGKLKESRKIILKKADYIIPGHGKMFKVKK